MFAHWKLTKDRRGVLGNIKTINTYVAFDFISNCNIVMTYKQKLIGLNLSRSLLTQVFCSARVESQKDKKQDCKSPKGRTPITEKGQRYPYNGGKSDSHRNINGDMEKQDAGNAITINPTEL